MIELLKASAGSGKTWNLAKTYIGLLLQNEDRNAYRHILAVTFTNKATDEMKSRILKELHLLSVHPEASGYLREFVPRIFPTLEKLQRKAEDVLYNILHDYGAFSVSTIDKFFQQTLKAFSREIGQFASYQVELDKDSLVSESVDRVLDSLSEENKALLDWLSVRAMEQLEEGRRFNIDIGLKEMAKRLKSDQLRNLIEDRGIDEQRAYSKETLAKTKGRLKEVMDAFRADLKQAARDVESAFSEVGISTDDTVYHFLGKVTKKFQDLDPRDKLPELTDTFQSRAADFGTWFKKADQSRYAGLENVLTPPVQAFCKRYNTGLKAYNTALLLSGQINDLGIASDLYKEFSDLMKEKNVLSLDDSNRILKNIIDGSDAPFVYERIGVRFEHFLLDEFQDTSRIQWDNFRPLIANSLAQGFDNLLVGDVKQSIYRWRGSDWKLMAEEVEKQFDSVVERNLDGNWRSLRALVEFNNDFFAYASESLDRMLGDAPFPGTGIAGLYGVNDRSGKQEVRLREAAEGSVEVLFCPEDRELDSVLQTIRQVKGQGARYGDITVLVRNNREGAEIAGHLMDSGIDVISDDSLKLKSSPAVRKLVSLISCFHNPEDSIGSFLALRSGLVPGDIACKSLLDLCEQLIRIARDSVDGPDTAVESASFDRETQYLQSFMDYVQDHVAVNGNALDTFLKAWDEADPVISSPSDADSVRVMTIHKSKGLEFPYVIFPFAEKVELFRPSSRWSVPDVQDTPLEGIGDTPYDILLSRTSKNTLFEQDYLEERWLQAIDNINTFYVALTRASKGMTVIARAGSKPDGDFSGILRNYLEEYGAVRGFAQTTLQEPGETADGDTPVLFRKGQPYDFTVMRRETTESGKLEPGYPSWPLGDRLKFRTDAADFFSDTDVLKPRRKGIVLHDILSAVITPSDLSDAVERAFRAGDLDRNEAGEAARLLSSRIAAHPDWFPDAPEEGTIFTETSLVDIDGETFRPDRVVLRDGRVTVIDYKFGAQRPDHLEQIARYAAIYGRLGHAAVDAAIWYVPEDRVVTLPISPNLF